MRSSLFPRRTSRNFTGMLKRPLPSSVCSKLPRNMRRLKSEINLMGNYPTLSHIGATYNFMSANCQQKSQIFRGFLCFSTTRDRDNILTVREAATLDIDQNF